MSIWVVRLIVKIRYPFVFSFFPKFICFMMMVCLSPNFPKYHIEVWLHVQVMWSTSPSSSHIPAIVDGPTWLRIWNIIKLCHSTKPLRSVKFIIITCLIKFKDLIVWMGTLGTWLKCLWNWKQWCWCSSNGALIILKKVCGNIAWYSYSMFVWNVVHWGYLKFSFFSIMCFSCRKVVINLLRGGGPDVKLRRAEVSEAAKMALKRDITNTEYTKVTS